MADGLITQTIPSLGGGVSQQTPSLRRANQCEAQENCRNDIVDGMGKRHNTEYLADITGITDTENYIFEYVERDENEKYIFAVKNGAVRVFDQRTGYEYTTNIPAWALNYLNVRGDVGAHRAYQLLNTIDTTFVLNKTVPVKRTKSTALEGEPPSTTSRLTTITLTRHPVPEEDYSYIQRTGNGDYTRARICWYEFTINGTVYRYEDAEDPLSVVAAQVSDWVDTEYPSATSVTYYDDKIAITLPPNEEVAISGIWRRTKMDSEGTKEYSGNCTTVNTEYLNVPAPSALTPSALWYVKQADYSTEYKLILDGTAFTIKTPDPTQADARAGLETGGLALAMKAEIDTDPTYAAVPYGSVLYIVRSDSTDFTIKAHDDLGDRASYAIKGRTDNFEDLPPAAPVDFQVEITGGIETDVDPYHVVYKETDKDGQNTVGYWEETVGYGMDTELDAQTMPLSLTRKQDVSYVTSENPAGIYFDLGETAWANRTVGDDITAPFPSFCSEQDDDGHIIQSRFIHNMGYYRNRLYLIGDENIVFSEAAEFLNFFPTTVITMLDGDVIDLAIPLNGVRPVEWAIEASESLLLFSPKKQFKLVGGDIFNTQSIVIDTVSGYDVDTAVTPFLSGAFVYFWEKGSTASQLMEYGPDGQTDKWVASQVTAHVPTYVRGQVIRTEVVPSERTMITIARDESGAPVSHVYIYNYLWNDGRRVINAWQKWTFAGDVVDAFTQNDLVRFLIQYDDGTVAIEEMNLAYDTLKDELGHPVYLDHREEVDENFVLPVDDPRELHTYQDRYFVGYPYNQRYVFSEFFPRTQEDKTLKGGRLQLRYLYMNFADTTYFKVIVKRLGRVDKELVFTGRNVTDIDNIIGVVPVNSGQQQFRIQSKSTNVEVIIENDSVFDAVFQDAEWEGTYVNRARRA